MGEGGREGAGRADRRAWVLAGSQELMFGKFYDLEVHDAGESADLVFDGRVRG